jgi:biopolymer transport protein ExbD
MAFGGFDKEDFAAPMAEINTTPLVDVMLVLLVIFLVTAPMLTQAIKLELPNETASSIADDKPIQISVDANGLYYWENTVVVPEDLVLRLKVAAEEDPKRMIHLRADKKTPYEKVSHILAAASKHGMTNIGFVTEPK